MTKIWTVYKRDYVSSPWVEVYRTSIEQVANNVAREGNQKAGWEQYAVREPNM